uniref:Peptidase S1 domain-containing protein n=1 Tax=Glossina pallidipes TaxID=7398 RepID=A0A1A9ZA63_GLOPL
MENLKVTAFLSNKGDYGAPLVFNNQLIDIMSYSLDSYSTFIIVGITKYADWIRQHLGDGHHRNSSPCYTPYRAIPVMTITKVLTNPVSIFRYAYDYKRGVAI